MASQTGHATLLVITDGVLWRRPKQCRTRLFFEAVARDDGSFPAEDIFRLTMRCAVLRPHRAAKGIAYD